MQIFDISENGTNMGNENKTSTFTAYNKITNK